MKGRWIPEYEQDAMVKSYLAGKTMREAAAPFGYEFRACMRALRKAGIKSRAAEAGKAPGKLTEQQKDEISDKYLAGRTHAQLAAEYGVFPNAIWQALRRRILPSVIRPTEDQQEAMANAYLAGAHMKEAAAHYGYFSASACATALRKRGITSRPASEAHRVYSLDEEFFDEIDTEEKAYWLGFIAADGYLKEANKGHRAVLIVGLHRRDELHLKKFAVALKSDRPVRRYEGKVVFAAVSARLGEGLLRAGIHQKKSFTVKPWPGPSELMRHYWRGIIDGDGCVCRHRGRRPYRDNWSVSLVGNRHIVTGFRDFVFDRISRTGGAIHDDPRAKQGICTIHFGGTAQAQEVVRLLYEGASIFLDRKKILADELMACKPAFSRIGSVMKYH